MRWPVVDASRPWQRGLALAMLIGWVTAVFGRLVGPSETSVGFALLSAFFSFVLIRVVVERKEVDGERLVVRGTFRQREVPLTALREVVVSGDLVRLSWPGQQTELGPFVEPVGAEDRPAGKLSYDEKVELRDQRARSVGAAIAGCRTSAPRAGRGRTRPSPGGVLIALAWLVSVLVIFR